MPCIQVIDDDDDDDDNNNNNNSNKNNSNNTDNDSWRVDCSRTVLKYFMQWPSCRLLWLTHEFPGSMTVMDFLINNEGQLKKEHLVSS